MTDKAYPRLFVCESPICGKVLGVIARDSQRNVSLYVLREPKPKGFEITDDLQLSKGEFSVLRMGYGVVPCLCGHDTTWHWNQHLLDNIIRRKTK